MPDVSHCVQCGSENAENTYFDVMNGAIICSSCLNKRGDILKKNYSAIYDDIRERSVIVPLNPSSLAALRYSLYATSEKMLNFSLTESTDLDTFSKACEEYLLHHLGHGFDSLDLYHSIL